MRLPLHNTEAWVKDQDNKGRKEFKNGQFVAAVATYSHAIVSLKQTGKVKGLKYTNLIYGLLDARAAAYEKAGDFGLAISDADTMIKISPRKTYGYLRKGRTLIRSKEHQKAFDTYSAAISACDDGDPKISHVQELLVKVQARLENDNCRRDPSILPIEVQHMIFNEIPYDQLISLSRVSKSWHRSVCSVMKIVTTIDLSAARRRVTNEAMQALLNRVAMPVLIATPETEQIALREKSIEALVRYINRSHTLEELHINGPFPFEIWDTLLRDRREEIRQIRLTGSGIKGHSVPWSNCLRKFTSKKSILARQMITFVMSCPKLQEVSAIFDLTKELECTSNYDSTYWREIIDIACPPLQVLKVAIHVHPGNEWIGLGPVVMLKEFFMRLCSTLRNIDVFGFQTHPVPNLSLDGSRTFDNLSSFPLLERLSLRSCLLDQCPIFPLSLKELYLDDTDFRQTIHNREEFMHMAFPALEVFDVARAHGSKQEHKRELLAILERVRETNHGKLRTLRLPTLLDDATQVVRLLETGFGETLRQLRLDFSTNDADTLAERLIKVVPDLEMLDVSDSFQITGYGIKKIVEGLPKLKLIRLDRCDRVSRDTFDWLETLSISYCARPSMSVDDRSRAGKGRKVRYRN